MPPTLSIYSRLMVSPSSVDCPYDTVELRTGRLHRIRRSEARTLVEEDRTVQVVKCYCRSNDVVTNVEAEQQARPTFIFPDKYFQDLEGLIGKELEGRMYSDSRDRRVKFWLDLGEHAGFQSDEGHNLESPWYDDRVMKE
jgi:hypothetical protein